MVFDTCKGDMNLILPPPLNNSKWNIAKTGLKKDANAHAG